MGNVIPHQGQFAGGDVGQVEQVENYTHNFFICPILKQFWEEVEKSLKYLLDLKEPIKL